MGREEGKEEGKRAYHGNGKNAGAHAKKEKENYYQIAKASGVSHCYVSRLMRGKQSNPSAGVVVDLARAMDMTPEELLIRLRIRGKSKRGEGKKIEKKRIKERRKKKVKNARKGGAVK